MPDSLKIFSQSNIKYLGLRASELVFDSYSEPYVEPVILANIHIQC